MTKDQPQPIVWCDKHEASRILSLSQDTLKRLRLSNQLIEGIHWVRFSSRCIRYNMELLQDWAATRTDAGQHERAIDNYLNSLPSNQPKSRGRRRKA